MTAELAEIRDFLAQHAPFDALDAGVLNTLPRQLSVRYARRGSVVLAAGRENHEMFVLRSGALEIRDADGALVERCEPGNCFGMSSLVRGQPLRYEVTALEDSLLLVLPQGVFNKLRRTQPGFEHFVSRSADRMRVAVAQLQASERGSTFLQTALTDLVQRAPVVVAEEASVREAAQVMAHERVSSLLVLRGEELVGIVTDRDLRNRVLADGRSADERVARIMTPEPVTAQAGAFAFEALLEMVRRNIHHLPVLEGGRVVGLVSSTDLLRLQTANPLYLVGEIQKQTTLAGLERVSRRLPGVVQVLVREDATADAIGRTVTAVGDALERRLLELAEAELGPPPVPYCWLVLGSQARLEQGLHSDQDNALLLADDARPEHDAYFAALARRVTGGLDACGYAYCPGEVMATNPRWRGPRAQWRRLFEGWVRRPEPEALLYSSIFFDLRALHGDASLLEELQAKVLAGTRGNQTFLAHLSRAALEHRPPLGFFRKFVLQRGGEHADTFDLKHGGVVPIVDLGRVYALAAGLRAVNTQARLAGAAQAGVLSAEGAADLRDALEFIAYVRLRHQGRQVAAGQEPNNFVSPTELSAFEKRHLRDAFSIVKTMQAALAQRYTVRF